MPQLEELVEGLPEREDEETFQEDPADIPEKASELAELAALLEAATAASAEEKRLKQARRRLVKVKRENRPESEEEALALTAEIRRLEERRVWQTVGCVAIIRAQECTTCGAKHEFFVGWFTVRTHATDKHLRDLRAGEPLEALPHWIEREDCGRVAVCANCCESQIAIDIATGKYPEVA